jgi:hypothetical protein
MRKYYVYIAISILFLYLIVEDLGIATGNLGWFSGVFRTADWKHAPNDVDFVTDRTCYEFYNERVTNWYRLDKCKDLIIIDKREDSAFLTVMPQIALDMLLDKTGTNHIVVALDYYSMMKTIIIDSLGNKKVLTLFPIALLKDKKSKEMIENKLKKGEIILYDISLNKKLRQINFRLRTKKGVTL